MSTLLNITRFPTKAMERKNVLPLYLEFKVSVETAPYLVSASTSVLWISEIPAGGILRAAVRQIGSPGLLFQELLTSIETKALDSDWGSLQPYSLEGLQNAVGYLQSYDLTELDVLVSMKKVIPTWVKEYPKIRIQPAQWLPPDYLVVVPNDRDFVGSLVYLDSTHAAAVVHNASRGIAICKNKS